MNKILRYSFMALLAMVFGNVMAGDVTFVPSDFPAASTEDFSATKDGVTVSVTASTTTNEQIRVYKNQTITISSTVGNITKVVFTCTANGENKYGPGCFAAPEVGSYTFEAEGKTGTWTGDAASFSLTASSNQVRITELVVTVGGAPAVTVAAPSISGTTPFLGSTEVTITNNEEGAKVYYTTDGNDPTASSPEYTTAFSITETTTVKAIAIKGETSSTVASKTFTAVPAVDNIAALNALENGSVFAFTGEPLVVYVSGKYAYIKDETGSSLIYSGDVSKLANLAVGKKVAANWTGKVSVYKNLFEAVPDAELAVTEAAAVAVTYPEAAVTDVVATNMNQVVVLKGVTYTAPEEGSKNFTITKGEAQLKGYNQFGIEIAAPAEGATYNITGVISVYNDDVQFQPISISEVVVVPEPQVQGTKIAEFDYTTAEAYPFFRLDPPATASYDVTGGALVINNTVALEEWWNLQPFVLDWFNVKEGANYNIAIYMEATDEVTYNINFGTWGSSMPLYGIKAPAARGWSVCTIENATFATSGNDAHILFQCGAFVGTVKIYKVELYEVAGTGINNVNAAKAENAVRYNLAGQKVSNDYKGVVIENGKKVVVK